MGLSGPGTQKSNRDIRQRAGLRRVITTVPSQKFILTKSAYSPNYPFDSYTKSHFCFVAGTQLQCEEQVPLTHICLGSYCHYVQNSFALTFWLQERHQRLNQTQPLTDFAREHKGNEIMPCHLPSPCTGASCIQLTPSISSESGTTVLSEASLWRDKRAETHSAAGDDSSAAAHSSS